MRDYPTVMWREWFDGLFRTADGTENQTSVPPTNSSEEYTILRALKHRRIVIFKDNKLMAQIDSNELHLSLPSISLSKLFHIGGTITVGRKFEQDISANLHLVQVCYQNPPKEHYHISHAVYICLFGTAWIVSHDPHHPLVKSGKIVQGNIITIPSGVIHRIHVKPQTFAIFAAIEFNRNACDHLQAEFIDIPIAPEENEGFEEPEKKVFEK